MEPIKTIDEIRSKVEAFKADGHTVGFVPTMGALHEGHLSLIRRAREKADKVVVSIFVNPTQFGPGEDFQDYPRTLDRDLDVCEKESVAAAFCPTEDIMYQGNQYISFQIDTLADHMCGAKREGHFEGVLQVVNKLFNIVKPDFAVFGQKDIQQFVLLRQMVKEFNHEVELVMGEIIRANDGLALSSRNAYLSDEERQIAPGLYRSLKYLKKQVKNGVDRVKLLTEHQKDELEAKGFKIDYLNIFTFDTLKPVKTLKKERMYIIAGAVYLGETRLIDNVIVEL